MKFLHKYLRIFQMGCQSAMEYRADFILSIFSGAFIIIIQCFIWTAVFSSSDSSVIYGYTYPEMIAYSIMAGLVNKMVSAGFEWEIAGDIKNGGLSKFIVQPIGYFFYRICSFLGRKAVQSTVLFFLSAVILLLCKILIGLDLDIVRLIIFIPFLFLAMVINFLIYFCVSSLAFIMTEVWGVFFAVGQGMLMLSGGIFPLDVFGEKISGFLSCLPFKYLIFYPVNIVNGRLPLGEIWNGAVMQGIWIILLTLLSLISWRSGMKKYVAVGG